VSSAPQPTPRPRRSLAPMIAVFLVSLAPIVAAFVVYFNPQWWPTDSGAYGQLVDPQRPIPGPAEMPLATLDGKPYDLNALRGRWVLATADDAECPESCARKLFIIRNTHASLGKNVDRLMRVWFITDGAPVPQKVLDAYKGTVMVRGKPADLAPFLLGAGPAAASAVTVADELDGPIWMIDPLGHLMQQFPDEADPVEVRNDVRKLISNSRIG